MLGFLWSAFWDWNQIELELELYDVVKLGQQSQSTAAFMVCEFNIVYVPPDSPDYMHYTGPVSDRNRMAWQWAETLVEIRRTLADIRGTIK